MTESMKDLVSRSTLGGEAWCVYCAHPDLVHDDTGCFSVEEDGEYTWTCSCNEFTPMTPAEWKRRRG